jgi:glycosyltransferase involved in cell wall biosynthesis
VVGTRAGGIPEAVVDGTSGLLVPPHDETALAEAIERLLGDADLRDRYGRAGRAIVEQSFGVDALVRGTAAVYERHQAPGVLE